MTIRADNNGPGQPGHSRNVSIAPTHLLRMARGFSCLFWGLPPMAMILTNTPDLVLSGSIRLPFLALGALAISGGLFLLSRVTDPTPRWRQSLRLLYACMLTATCLAPFLYWWRQFPLIAYYTVNALLFFGVLTGLLFMMNRLAGEVGRAMCDSLFLIETLLSRWAVLVAVLAPLLFVGIVAVRAVARNPTLTYWELSPFQPQTPRWALSLFILPLALTMAVTWKAKSLCFESLKRCAKFPPPPEDSDDHAFTPPADQ